MPNIVNLYAESGADLIGDDNTPTLALYNTGNGPGLQVGRLNAVSTASIDVLDVPIVQASSATGRVTVRNTVVGNQSIGLLRLQGNSVASGAVFEFSNKAFVSITSVLFTNGAAAFDYAIPVQIGTETRYLIATKTNGLAGAAAF